MKTNSGWERTRTILAGESIHRPVRGEIWPLPDGGSAADVLAVAKRMHMDFCFFDHYPGAAGKAHALGIAAGAVVNGPWQRWMIEVGWETAMLQLGRGTPLMEQGLFAATKKVEKDIAAWADSGIDMLLLADDIAYAAGPCMSPQQVEHFLVPCYRRCVVVAAQAKIPMGFHTDGKAERILSILRGAGFGFFSLEPEGINPLQAWETMRESVPLLSGVPADWLLPSGFLPEREGRELRNWLANGPLMVSSACGLFQPEAETALKQIYQWLDTE
jgi:hypothetical protein